MDADDIVMTVSAVAVGNNTPRIFCLFRGHKKQVHQCIFGQAHIQAQIYGHGVRSTGIGDDISLTGKDL